LFLLDFVFLLGLPSTTLVVAWIAAAKNLPRPRISATDSVWKGAAGGRLLTLILLPCVLPILGLSVSFVTLDREADGGVALQAAAVAYGVPASFAGLGIALVYSRCIEIAVGTKQGFSRVLPVAAAPMSACVFGALTALILVGWNLSGGPATGIGIETGWWASFAASVGGAGSFSVVSLTRAKWDFRTTLGWARTIRLFGWGGLFSVTFFALAMVLLREWIIGFLIVGSAGFSLLSGVIRFRVARGKRAG
jgi:hypothetical protein